MRALLRRFAATPPAEPHGLIVLTSRLAVADIARWKDGAAPVVDVENMSDEAGSALLRDNGVWGTDWQLKEAAQDFGGHPLALGLFASFLKETQTGDVRRRDHIRGLLADAANPGHDHARRAMESLEKELLAAEPVLLAIMQMVGLFDRPASGDCFAALRAEPTIPRTDRRDRRSERRPMAARRHAAARGRGCCRRSIPSDPEALDAHPLVREWFGESAAADERSGVEGRPQPPLRAPARHDQRRQDADARRSRAALPRHRPRLPRRATAGGAGGSLCEPHLPPVPGRRY